MNRALTLKWFAVLGLAILGILGVMVEPWTGVNAL